MMLMLKSNGKLRQALVFHLDGTDDDVCPEGLEQKLGSKAI
jgi:predicted esterase